jgi:predicted peroxiredoxin
MAKFLFFSSNGSENPTKATMPLLLAKAAVEEGHEVKVGLVADGAVNIRDAVIGSIQGVGLPAYKELFEFLVAKQVNFFV